MSVSRLDSLIYSYRFHFKQELFIYIKKLYLNTPTKYICITITVEFLKKCKIRFPDCWFIQYEIYIRAISVNEEIHDEHFMIIDSNTNHKN